MQKIHTHYDNLRVARNAPLEIIRAAYRTLSQKYHPDRNPGNDEAARIMAIINASYDALSNPATREAHDLWIIEQEQMATRFNYQRARGSAQTETIATGQQEKSRGGISKGWVWFGVAVLGYWLLSSSKPSSPPQGPKPYQTNPSVSPLDQKPYQVAPYVQPPKPAYIRPETAPNGQPWPATAGYVAGYKRLLTGGLSTVTVDNSLNDSDVFVKLVSLDGPQAYPVRTFFISAHSTFKLNKINVGRFDIRYRDLSSGALSRSEAFELEEIRTQSGTQFSNVTMTLYKVQHGNMQTYGLSESEF